jgi:hypothetical protein
MAFTVRDLFEARVGPGSDTVAPSSGAKFDYIAGRFLDSFNLPGGPLRYLELMNPALPDHETTVELLGHGRSWRMIVDEWPIIRADIDSGHPSTIALVETKSLNPLDLGKNHHVLAYGYDLTVTHDLTLHICDSNHPDDDGVTLSLNISDPQHTTTVTYSDGSMVIAYFRTQYRFTTPLPWVSQ